MNSRVIFKDTLRDTLKLLKIELKLLKSELKGEGKKQKRGFVGMVIGLLLLGGIVVFFSSMFFGLLRTLPQVGEEFDFSFVYAMELNLISASFILFFLLLLFNGVKVIYENYFESGDVTILLSYPLPVKSIFLAKFVRSLFTNFIYVVPFICTIWIGYGIAVGAGIGYFFMVFFVLLLGGIIFNSVASMLILLLVKLIPATRFKQAITVVSLIGGLVVFGGSQYLARGTQFDMTTEDMAYMVDNLGQYIEVNLPHVWLAEFLLFPVNGHDFSFLGSFLPVILTGGLLFVLSIKASELAFLTGWSKNIAHTGNESREEKKEKDKKELEKRRRILDFAAKLSPVSFVPPLKGIFKKDLLYSKRTPFMWYSFFMFVVIFGISIFNTAGSIDGKVDGIFNAANTATFLLILLMGSLGASSIGGVSVSMEGRALWLLKTSPIKPRELYMGKLFFGFGISFSLTLVVFLACRFLGVPVFPFYIFFPLMAVLLAAFNSLVLYLDVEDPDFDIGNKINQVGGDTKIQGELNSLKTMFLIFLLVGYFAIFLTLIAAFTHVVTFFLFLPVILVSSFLVIYWCYKKSVFKLNRLLTGEM